MPFLDRLQHAWSVFTNRDPPRVYADYGYGVSFPPDRQVVSLRNERSIVNSVYTRISVDCSLITIEHARLDENGRFLSVIKDGLNDCLTLEANRNQTGRAFIRDLVYSMLDEGTVAVVPTIADRDPLKESYEIEELRVAEIKQYYPNHVTVRVFNQDANQFEEITVPKKICAIVENPFSTIMNHPNSTLSRLVAKLDILDAIDKQSGSGKLDLIIQLPYVIKTEARRQQADNRRKEIERQLEGSKYGIAYTDGTEHITQLNRPVENNLMKQIEYLTDQLYSQLGLSKGVLDGTADERTMNRYETGTLEPILLEICDEFMRKFLTKTARTQGQAVKFYRDPFRLAPISSIADIADKFTRNAVLSSNEVRQIVGFKPVQDPQADELRNHNLNETEGQTHPSTQDMQSEEGG